MPVLQQSPVDSPSLGLKRPTASSTTASGNDDDLEDELVQPFGSYLNSHCSSLYSGSKFKGQQKSGRNSYEVLVEFQASHIDSTNYHDSTIVGMAFIYHLVKNQLRWAYWLDQFTVYSYLKLL